MAKLTVEILQEKHAAALEELALKRDQTTESLRDEIMKTGMGGPWTRARRRRHQRRRPTLRMTTRQRLC